MGLLLKYHEERKAAKKRRQSKGKKTPNGLEPSDEMTDVYEHEMDRIVIKHEFLSASFIEDAKLLAKKVLNITHVKGEEKNLVAEILFDGANAQVQSHVHADWANINCPQLVIEFYESRIFWQLKS